MIRQILLITTVLSTLIAFPAMAQKKVVLDPEPDASEIFPDKSSPVVEEEKEEVDDSASYRRMLTLEYSADDIYSIPTKCGYQTSIVFDSDEEIETISVGDRSTWQIIPAGSRLFIRPLVEGIATNMTVLTNQRSYQFDIKSARGKKGPVVYVAKFTYKPETPAPTAAPFESASAPAITQLPFTSPTAKTTPAFVPPPMPASDPRPSGPRPPAHVGITTPENPNYNYTYAGPDDLAPLRVYDDGSATYIKYRDVNQPIPNAYVRDASGNETMVPSRVQNGLMVIDAVAGELALKNSSGIVQIYNENINPR
jgi:type IV secretion system protein VirB9